MKFSSRITENVKQHKTEGKSKLQNELIMIESKIYY